MKAVNVLLSILISLLMGVLVLEGGLRLLDPKKINRPDDELGWVKRPDFEFRRQTKEFDVTLRTNSLGLRDDPMESPAKPEGAYRVVCLGDSFTLGYTVSRDDLFVDQLERWWLAEGRNVDVVNAGTEAYSTDQEAAWLVHHGEAFAPDLVLLFPYENDVWWSGRLDYLGQKKPRFTPEGDLEDAHLEGVEPGFFGRTAIGTLLRRTGGRSVADESVELGGRTIFGEFAPLLNDPPPQVTEAEAHTRGALRALARACERLDAKLVVVPIPSHSAIDPAYASEKIGPEHMGGLDSDQWSPDRPVDFFLDAVRELRDAGSTHVAALDPRPALRAAAAGGAELYFHQDFHLTPAGNLAFTRFVKEGLEALDRSASEGGLALFPDSHRAERLADLPPVSHVQNARFPTWAWIFLGLWLVLGVGYGSFYKDENTALGFLKVGALLAVIFVIAVGGMKLIGLLPPAAGRLVILLFVAGLLGFIGYKLGRRTGTILELFKSFVLRGHWYLMPLVVVLMTVGSLLVVAASSPLVAPFIYTLF